ncbi:kinase-like domain-containing protein [Mycena rebaudengoi]|nr:kinase-like domain-containing protein [Mycena rebaudengoi]
MADSLFAKFGIAPPEAGKLESGEVFWADHQPWLETCGYRLRPRYAPNWVASWIGTDKSYRDCEDGLSTTKLRVIDAVRIKDGAFVTLKQVKRSEHVDEADIGAVFSAEPLASDPLNHCVPLYEVLQVPDNNDLMLLVMPLLFNWKFPPFVTIGEIVDFFGQLIEGLQFMHKHRVAHCDCKIDNIMMDGSPLYPEPRHPVDFSMKRDWSGPAKYLTRTQRPVKYYFIDFGLSKRYAADQSHPLESPAAFGSVGKPPEFKTGAMCDPFAIDVFSLGDFMREMFTEGSQFSRGTKNLEFMNPLIASMIQDDPKLRPKMDEVAVEFLKVRKKLRWWKLRARAAEQTEGKLSGFFKSTVHWMKQAVISISS